VQALLAYPDVCTRGETVCDPRTGAILSQVSPLPEDVLYPKEQTLLEQVRRERTRERRVWLYLTHTESRDLTPRLWTILEGAGIRVAILKAGTVSADQREEWVAARIREDVDVVLSHPRLVQTGLNYRESNRVSSRFYGTSRPPRASQDWHRGGPFTCGARLPEMPNCPVAGCAGREVR
jgi:hypothetical protein